MNWFKHISTISRHRHMVIKHCFMAGIGFQGLFHDLSKYSPAEFLPGIKYYQGVRSPNEKERETNGYSTAWMHHKGRNCHHFEYWTDYNPKTKIIEPIEMPLKYVKEMFCDRVAASKIYQDKKYSDSSAYEYFLGGIKTRTINPKTSAQIEKLLKMLSEKGEKKTFDFIKNMK